MRKLFAIILAAMLLMGLGACGGGKGDETTTTAAATVQPVLGQGSRRLTLVAVLNASEGVDGEKQYEYAYEGELTVQAMADGLAALTGIDFGTLEVSNADESTMVVSWPADSALFGGGSEGQKEEFFFFDYDSNAWFMLDSLYATIRENMPGIQEIYFAMNGDQSLVLENLSPPMDFGFDAPYMMSVAYLDGRGDVIDEEPVDPADVNWWGEYGSEIGLLHINNYNDRGMGWSFHFTFDNDGVIDEGVAALDPGTGILASYEKYEFRFNMEQDTVTVWVDGGSAVDYMRTDDAVG